MMRNEDLVKRVCIALTVLLIIASLGLVAYDLGTTVVEWVYVDVVDGVTVVENVYGKAPFSLENLLQFNFRFC